MLKQLFADYKEFRWLFVYTLEAHAEDEWPISSSRYNPSGEPVRITQHKTQEERVAAALNFQEAFEPPFTVVVDTIEDDFESVFSTWPFRFYVLHHRKVVFQAQPQDGLVTYPLEPLLKTLNRMTASNEAN